MTTTSNSEVVILPDDDADLTPQADCERLACLSEAGLTLEELRAYVQAQGGWQVVGELEN